MALDVLAESTLAEVCCLVTDGTHDTPKRVTSGYPLIKAKEIVGGRIDFESCDQISEAEHRKVIARSKPELGDTLFTHIGASLGEAAFVNTSREFSIKNIALFKPNPAVIVPRYLYYLVISPTFKDAAIGTKTGSAQPFLGLSQLRGHAIQYHRDLSIQRRIAGILTAYDELIENNQRRIRILEEMARSLYREWFVHFRYPGHETDPLVDSPLGQIPQGGKVKRIGDVAATFRGRSYRSVDLADEGGVPFLNLKCLDRDGGFRRSGIKRYVGEFKEAHLARKGDIVMAVTDMTQERRIVARAALVPSLDNEFGVFSMDLVRIEPKGEMPKSFLYSFLRYSSFADEVKQHANGANVLHLSPERITDFRFSVPPVDLMERFVRFVAPTLEQMDVLQNQTANLRRTRDLLLPRLLSGKVHLLPEDGA
jgi:type I restriction enzyme S subunit